MKIVKLNSDDTVMLHGDDLTLDASGFSMPGMYGDVFTTSNATLVEDVTLPTGYIDGGFTYASGTFTPNATGQENIDVLTNAGIIAQIEAIEATVTQRRIREAVLGTDAGWLSDQEDAIAALRATLV